MVAVAVLVEVEVHDDVADTWRIEDGLLEEAGPESEDHCCDVVQVAIGEADDAGSLHGVDAGCMMPYHVPRMKDDDGTDHNDRLAEGLADDDEAVRTSLFAAYHAVQPCISSCEAMMRHRQNCASYGLAAVEHLLLHWTWAAASMRSTLHHPSHPPW